MKTGLVFNSGGFKGLLSAKFYKEVENMYSPDLLAGSSTGSILSLAISMGIKADKIIDLYLNEAKKIFLPSNFYKLKSLNGLLLPKYDAGTLEKVLKDVFGTVKLGEIPIKFMCNAYDLTTNEPIYFKSWKSEFKNIEAWKAVRASCSAPTYFSAFLDDNKHRLVDGGVDSGTLTLSTYTELKRESLTENIKIVEFGTVRFKR
jgi:predicted acylesterase/phospholipase RssA